MIKQSFLVALILTTLSASANERDREFALPPPAGGIYSSAGDASRVAIDIDERASVRIVSIFNSSIVSVDAIDDLTVEAARLRAESCPTDLSVFCEQQIQNWAKSGSVYQLKMPRDINLQFAGQDVILVQRNILVNTALSSFAESRHKERENILRRFDEKILVIRRRERLTNANERYRARFDNASLSLRINFCESIAITFNAISRYTDSCKNRAGEAFFDLRKKKIIVLHKDALFDKNASVFSIRLR